MNPSRLSARPPRPGAAVLLPQLGLLVALVLALVLAACGGGGVDKSKAQLRLVNASQYSALALLANDQVRQSPVAYGQDLGYAEQDSGTTTLAVSQPGAASSLVSASQSLEKGRYYTVLAYGSVGALKRAVLDDNQAEPDTGKALVRVLNAAADAGTLDVYLTGADELLTAAVPVQAAAAVGTANPWLTVNSGGWRLRATAAGSKTDVRLDLRGVNLASRQMLTLVLTPGSGGVLANALALTQRGGVAVQDNTQARVRVAAALDGGAAVSARVGDVPVFTNTPAPAMGIYTLVNAGTPAVALTAGGVALPTPARNMAAGSDQTLLVFGSTSTTAQQAGALPAQGVWLSDDNRLVGDATQTRLRLVNGLSDAGSSLALTVDFVSLADSVAPGAASPYAAVVPGVTSRLAVVGNVGGAGLVVPEQVLTAGATYSVFMTGSAAAPQLIVRRDR